MHDFSLMGIDIGTSSVKVLLWSSNGNFSLACRPAKGSYVQRHGSGIPEQDPIKLWSIVVECIKEVLKGCDARSVAGIGLAGHSPSLVAVGCDGDSIGNIITWMDPRPVMAEDCRNTSNGPSFEATAKWIAKQLKNIGKGEIEEGRVRVLQPKDYIGLRLTGEMCIDSSSISCMDRSFPVAKLFPEVANPWEAMGNVTRDASDETGLPPGIPVAAGSIDAFVEALGAGVIEPGLICDSTGTSTCLSLVAPDESDLCAVKHVIPGAKLVVAPISYSGGCLAWAMSVLFPEVYSSQLDWSGTVAEALERSKPGASGLIFLPYLVGKRSPVAIPTATGAFLGLRPEHTSYHMIRAVLEGCTYAMRRSMEAWKDSVSVTGVRAVGSGARHRGWLKMKADVLNLPVASMKVREGTVLGAAILAGVAGETFGSIEESVEALVLTNEVLMPEDIRDDGYRSGYEEFCRAESALESFWNTSEAAGHN